MNRQKSEVDEELDKRVCFQCVGEDFLSNLVQKNGVIATCSYCASSGLESFVLAELAGEVAKVFDHSWTTTPRDPDAYESALLRDRELNYEWNRQGISAEEVVEEVAKVSDVIARDVIELLGEDEYYDPKAPDFEPRYCGDALYEQIVEDAFSLNSDWEEMRRRLHHQARFFNKDLMAFLADLFRDIHLVRSSSGPAVRRMGPSTADEAALYRARVCLTADMARDILSKAPASLGAPSGRLVRAGRMNAAGIAVFYGSFERETCLAEVRAPVGSSVAMGKFKLIRDVQLLDLKGLEEALDDTSPFDPEFTRIRRKFSFLKTLSTRFSSPVMPGGEEFDYLLTQAVCEYLGGSVEPRLDGIVFPSSQTGGTGTNVTLFPHASAVEPVSYPAGTKVSTLYSDYDEDDAPSYTVWVELPEPTVAEPIPAAEEEFDMSGFFDIGPADEDEIQTLGTAPTLRLDLAEMQVIEITGVSYSFQAIDVSRYEAEGRKQEF